MTKKKVIVFIYNSFNDPLFSGTVLVYLKTIASNNCCDFHLITFEQPAYTLTTEEKISINDDLNKLNIFWTPLQYHTGGPLMLFKKLYDFLIGFYLILKLKNEHQCSLIISFGNISGGFGFLYAKLLKLENFIFSYEPHSEFMADFGIWKKNSLKYKILNKIERLMGMYSTYIATGTSHMVERMKSWKSKAQIYRLPSCVDSEKFCFNKQSRKQMRSELGINDHTVFLYLGKFNGLYYNEEIALVCETLYKANPKSYFLIVTPNDKAEISSLFNQYEIPLSNLHITYSSYERVQDYISAADIGIVAIPPWPSQKFRSPIKVGEYLLCGLPYLVTKGVSEDDSYAEKYNVGITVNAFTVAEIERIIPDLNMLLTEDEFSIKSRCREVGLEYRGNHQAINVFVEILKTKLFSAK